MPSLERIHAFSQLKIIADPHRLSILKHLMESPATISQLGRDLGEHPAWIRHHLKKLEQAGMVELTETKVSEGYIEKYYQAKASAFLFHELLLPTRPGKHTIVLSGSHDLALETLSRSVCGDLDLFTLPVGSLDGLVALRQGICNAAGCHLYDASSGEFNSSYVRHLFPDKKMVLLTLAHREQGLMVPPGNPDHVRGIADLLQPIRFINRNPGSGTRLWLDSQLNMLGISPEQVLGYTDEAYTHTQVAKAIQSGHARLGLGIHAAAAAHSLGFIPLFHERYDLVLTMEQMADQSLSPLFDKLYSGEFRQQVETLKGYDVTHLGDQIVL